MRDYRWTKKNYTRKKYLNIKIVKIKDILHIVQFPPKG